MLTNYKYLYISAIACAFLSLYLISFSIYNLPSADDFIYGASHNLSPLSLSLNDYLHGSSGRIFSNILYYYFATISNNNLAIYKIVPLIVMTFFVFCIYLLFSLIFNSLNRKIIISFVSIFIFVWFISLASINDTVFWYGGIFNYLLPMSLMFFSIYLFFKGYFIKNNFYKICYYVLSSIILFISSFSNEALFLVFYIIYMFIIFYSILYKHKQLFFNILPLIIILNLAFILILFSPGSANRAITGGEFMVWII